MQQHLRTSILPIARGHSESYLALVSIPEVQSLLHGLAGACVCNAVCGVCALIRVLEESPELYSGSSIYVKH